MSARGTVLLTGATGFVGRHVAPALLAAGYRVRGASRDPSAAQLRQPELEWVRLDMDDPATLAPALEGCQAVVYLVHAMAGGKGYTDREAEAALALRAAAPAAGVQRIVYLGGVEPQGPPSRHLASRLATGRLLREGPVSAVELRAAMIVGAGSESWLIVRDLCKRLPVMLLPAWLRNHSWPVAIDDVVAAVLAGIELQDEHAGWYDVPGPERLSHKELLLRVARHLGRRPPMLDVPVLTPRLSSYWLGLVTSADLTVARELVDGLCHELDPSGRTIWEHLPDHRRVPLDAAIAHALADERYNERPTAATWTRLTAIGAALAPRVTA